MQNIFKWFTLDENETVVYIAWFTDRFDENEFIGIDKVFNIFLKYCAFLGVSAQKRYMEAFLTTEGKRIIKEHNIRIDAMEPFNYNEPGPLEEAYRVISGTALNCYDEYMSEDLTGRTFKVDMYQFIRSQKKERIQRLMAETFPKLNNGDDVDDVATDMETALGRISSVYDVEHLTNLDFLTGKQKVQQGTVAMRRVFTWGIPALDGDTGGAHSKQMITFTAPPGGGKTRFACAHVAYRAAVVHKVGVLFDEMELTKAEVENMLISIHIVYLFGGKVKIPDSLINRDLLSDEQRRYVEAAKIDLFESGKYGRIMINDEDQYVDTLTRDKLSYFKANPDIEVWVVDYAGIWSARETSGWKKTAAFEVITDGLKAAKNIAKKADIVAFVVNQFNDEGIKASAAGKTILPGHVQGGHIVQRHSDYDLVMTMTEEQEIANIRQMSTVKKRAASGLRNIPISVDLSVSRFSQLQI